jgi:PAS domain-containing protein
VDEFSQEDERLATILAARVGRVYQNGSQYSEVLSHAACLEREVAAHEHTTKALAQRVREGALFAEVDAALAQGYTQTEMLQRCAQALLHHLDVALARVWIFDEDEQVLELKTSVGPDVGPDDSQNRISLGQFAVGWSARERSPYFTNAVPEDRRVGDENWAKRENLISFAGCPLIFEDRLTVVVGVYARRRLNNAIVEMLGRIAHRIALGIERHRANVALREREEHIRLLLDSTGEAIYRIDLEGNCTFANSACALLLGYADTQQLLGRNMHSLMHHTRPDGSPYREDECRILESFRRNQGAHVDDEVL